MGDDTKQPADGLDALMRGWSEWTAQAMKMCQAWDGGTASPEAVRQLRSSLFSAWSDGWDAFLRSPLFLDAERQGLAQSAELHKQFRDYLARLHHEWQSPTSQDLDEVMLALRRLEHRLLDEFEDLAERVDNLVSRVDALAARLDAGPGNPPPQDASSLKQTSGGA